MTRPDRRNTILVAILGFGLLALLYAVWIQKQQATDDRAAVKLQQQTVAALLAKDAVSTQELAALRTLVQALQAQVRALGGTPLTQAPTPAATSQGSSPSGTAQATPTPRAARSPSPTPPASTTPRPTPSSTPVSPSPSPRTTACVGPVCVTVGGTP